MNWLIASIILICVMVDGLFTHRRVKKYGNGVELNSIARWAMKTFGTGRGIILSLAIPNVSLVSLLVALAQHDMLLILLGARLCFVALNLYSLKLEKTLDSNLIR